jgi:hypothetical protein
MYTREDSFEYQVKEIVKKFMKDMDGTLNKKSDINDVIWKNKEEFGEIAYNLICEYFGSDFITEIFDENKEELIEDDGEEDEE